MTIKRSLLLATITLFSLTLNSQTANDRQKNIDELNPQRVSSLLKRLQTQKAERDKRITEYLTKHPLVKRSLQSDQGGDYQLVDIDADGNPVYYQTSNRESAAIIRTDALYKGGRLELDINGEDMVAGVWDAGMASPKHQEFKESEDKESKIHYMEKTFGSLSHHTTHVCGTIAAMGVDPEAKGLASKSSIMNYQWNNDKSEMAEFAAKGYLVSNHSYNPSTFRAQVWIFGAYDREAGITDQIAYTFPKYQVVKAAANDRERAMVLNPKKNGYELTISFSNSKNVLTIAAIEPIAYYTPETVRLAAFSNTGPTDDGRIKPNLAAKGVSVYSSTSTGYDEYSKLDGTSMASPAITAGILLIQQLYNDLYGNYMNSATVRGLLQHTALEAGADDGPDYGFGWGVANIEDAASAIISKDKGSVIEENTLDNGQIYTKDIYVDSGLPLRVSISWTDPAGPIADRIVDWEEKSLVNDLDVVLEDEAGNKFYPWKLDGKNPANAATTGNNEVDNFERIDVPNPLGKYTITVSHKGTLVEDYTSEEPYHQDYSLIITEGNSTTPSSIVAEGGKQSPFKVYPTFVKDQLFVEVAEKATGYQLFSLTGKIIMQGSLNEGHNTLDASSVPAGVYLLSIKGNSTTITQKIIEQ
ncbi:serine protease AprX [Dysgonomonas sp. PH5-45]|uniref:S8 family serine peptidase n=1 Tax=unclassified Dysgonomonas TaxID=2630389 RepID=UPI002473D682|nr:MULTISPECIES: S8 family serine peptidase [unclassified Dysgonomonas]MDH6355531.1 serine protease AprX [Dysgonomonas sp. PH5-45]MDH6388408.1 serine protease AprX [Dysgonomonas sp. PH5-37]